SHRRKRGPATDRPLPPWRRRRWSWWRGASPGVTRLRAYAGGAATRRNPGTSPQRRRAGVRGLTPSGSAAVLRRLIDAAMDLERRTMRLYCSFESQFSDPEELRTFWFDMAQHESRHFGALALVAGLIESASPRALHPASSLTPARVQHLRR